MTKYIPETAQLNDVVMTGEELMDSTTLLFARSLTSLIPLFTTLATVRQQMATTSTFHPCHKTQRLHCASRLSWVGLPTTRHCTS